MDREWISAPWQDTCQATMRHAWEMLTRALTCGLLGHRGTEHHATSMTPPWRTCDRCEGKWEYRER